MYGYILFASFMEEEYAKCPSIIRVVGTIEVNKRMESILRACSPNEKNTK